MMIKELSKHDSRIWGSCAREWTYPSYRENVTSSTLSIYCTLIAIELI